MNLFFLLLSLLINFTPTIHAQSTIQPTAFQPTPTTAPSTTRTPLPGTIQAEAFTAAFDSTSGNFFTSPSTISGADVKQSGSSAWIGHFQIGEWVEYPVSVNQAGSFSLTLRAGAANLQNRVRLSLNGSLLTTVSIPSVSAWDQFSEVTVQNLQLPQGNHTLRITMDGPSDFADIDWFRFDNTSASLPSPTQQASNQLCVTEIPNPAAIFCQLPPAIRGFLEILYLNKYVFERPSNQYHLLEGIVNVATTIIPTATRVISSITPTTQQTQPTSIPAPTPTISIIPPSTPLPTGNVVPATSLNNAIHGFNASKVNLTCPTIPTSGFITVRPTDNVGSKTSSAGTNAVFVFEPGIYSGASITPLNGQKFYAKPGVEFNGNLSTRYAFFGNASDVYICGFKIRRYNPDRQRAAVNAQNGDAGAGNTAALSYRWTIENIEVSESNFGGVMLGSDSVLRNSKVHNNIVIGVKASGTTNAVFDNIEVNNNCKGCNWGDEGGGSKFAYATNLVVRNSYFHDNLGPGIWTDILNRNTLYEGNLVTNNTNMGIFHEISFSATIRNNVVINNGNQGGNDWALRKAGIYISSSVAENGKLIEIYNNYLENNFAGITGTPDSRDTVGGMWVHNNRLVNSGYIGVSQGGSPNAPRYETIRYDRNRYEGRTIFEWKSITTWTGWRNNGLDINGSYSP